MQVDPPPLLPILRSKAQGAILTQTYLHPEREFTVGELAEYGDATVSATSREISRLVSAGLLQDRRQGNRRLVRRADAGTITRPLTELLLVTLGPLTVMEDELRGITGIDEAFIYGSWAARYAGEQGPQPNDLDVLVVGDPDLDALDEVAVRARRRLGGTEVNIRRVRTKVWQRRNGDDPFIASLLSRPITTIKIDQENETHAEVGTGT